MNATAVGMEYTYAITGDIFGASKPCPWHSPCAGAGAGERGSEVLGGVVMFS